MEMVNFYVPSEAQILLNPETSAVAVINYCFYILTTEDGLYLELRFESYSAQEEIPEPICKQICDMALQRRLTNAVVNQLLLPLKAKLIQSVPESKDKTQINISKLFMSAKGYIAKGNDAVAVFTSGALCPDVFNNKYSICFALPIHDKSKTILLVSEKDLLQEQQSVLFMFYALGQIYRATAIPKNGIFQLQQIAQASSMQHQYLFESDQSLSDIYQRFTMKKNRLNTIMANA